MRILLCSQTDLVRTLGASKPLIELADEFRGLGWDCDLTSPYAFGEGRSAALQNYPTNLRRHILEHGDSYDVIDYDHEYLPFERRTFSDRPLMVARSVLLVHYLEPDPIPQPWTLKAVASRIVRGPKRRRANLERIRRAERTIEAADLVNVSNSDDREELIRRGVPSDKVVSLPLGLNRATLDRLGATEHRPSSAPVVAFVGTFDYRKGACEFPGIVRRVAEAVPEVRFRLCGTSGLFPTEESVLRHFPAGSRDRISVVSRFDPESLPELLQDCAVGIFPSHYEGFGLGVVEMLAAGLPVVAYSTPGPRDILPPEYLVPRGDHRALADRVIALLRDHDGRPAARQRARESARRFDMNQIAARTDAIYREQVERRKGRAVGSC